MLKPDNNLQSPPLMVRIIFGTSGFVSAGIGLTIIIFMWTADFLGEAPVFMKIFASFIGIAFIAFGGSMGIAFTFGKSKLLPRIRHSQSFGQQSQSITPNSQDTYACPHCNAPLASDADISPSGDARCSFCDSWFNVRR